MQFDPELECFVNSLNKEAVYAWSYVFIGSIYLAILVFFMAAILRMYRVMRRRKDLTLNVESMVVYWCFFLAYATAFTVYVVIGVLQGTMKVDDKIRLMKEKSIASII